MYFVNEVTEIYLQTAYLIQEHFNTVIHRSVHSLSYSDLTQARLGNLTCLPTCAVLSGNTRFLGLEGYSDFEIRMLMPLERKAAVSTTIKGGYLG